MYARATLLALLLSLTPPLAMAQTPSQQLALLLDDVWQQKQKDWPQSATRNGDRRYNDRLASISVAAADRRAAADAAFLVRLGEIDRDQLAPSEVIEAKLLRRTLAESAIEHAFGEQYMPITNRTGFHISFPELADWVPLETVEDYDNYLARLRAFSDYADGHIELMRAGIQKGLTIPAVILEGYEQSIDTHLVDDPTASLLYKPFKEFPDAIPASEHQRLRADARDAIENSIIASYRRFGVFMADEYVPNCRASIGASAMPGGREYYRHCVRKYTTLDTTPDEVHQIGLAEVKRIRAEMDEVIDQTGFETDNPDRFAAFVEFLRTDPQFYAQTEDELLDYTAGILKRIDGELPALFGRMPRMPYGLKPVPEYIAPKTTMAYYQRPNGDGSKAGFFYMNTFNLASRPKYMLQALSLHEAVPGHHLQIALQQELEGLSPLRKFGGFTAFIEGWALYAERLGQEVGFYEDPYSDFGRLTMEVWRASRLVVDTGIHYKGWTRQQGIDFLTNNSAMSAQNIRAEVDRYIGWPGQALAYKTGELKIRELRAKAEDQLGDAFDVRAFHDAVLENGAVPLTVLEGLIEEWVATQTQPATIGG